MNTSTDRYNEEALKSWIKENLNDAVHKFINKNKADSPGVEAKPAWVLPFKVLIGKIRTIQHQDNFTWFICGELPTDYLESSVAKTPREAARHISMKWQLTASKYQGKDTTQDASQIAQEDVVNNLIEHAHSLYDLVEEEQLWL